jgi:hypothetical protein
LPVIGVQKHHSPGNVRRVENTKPYGILMIGYMDIVFESQDFCITHIGTIDEGAQKQERKDR